MAAASSRGGSAVSVLAPTGRRLTVRVEAGTALLQVGPVGLKRPCFSCRFQRTLLDLSLQWRFANLPNNAKLEMVPVSRSRAGPENTVRIALQLDDGSRLQDAFRSGQTLWDVIRHFVQTRECVEHHSEFSPVCIYMRDEVTGKTALERTTLKSLGLTGGNAIIRVIMKKCSLSGQEEAVGGDLLASPTSTRRPVGTSLHIASLFTTNLACTDGSFSTSNCVEESGGDSEDRLEELQPAPSPFVPFFGDGECLGGSPVAEVSLDMPSSKLPTCPSGPSKPKKSKTSQEQLSERESLVCHLDLQELLPDEPQDLPDDFFEVTVDDVRKRLIQLQSERQRLEEAPLMTKTLREAQMKEKLERYPKVVLRVHFPDRHVLQGFFCPTETGKNMSAFVSQLALLHLVIAPPRTILSDESLTLFQVRAAPSTL
uniref:ASPSCR1 tether for SLC2A4, UBX domain containing n=1 Tax=Sphenodon punctatus TaxID=8508 RepID=A0A8D0GP51_SPHPU